MSRGPSIEEITAKENHVIEFIINKHTDDFSLEMFKQEYAFYSKDLCDITEVGFIDYMYTFFRDKGMPAFAVTVREGSRYRIAHDVVRDMKRAFTKLLYDELVENSLYYAPPYLPLYGFMQQTKKGPMLSLTVMEWETGNTQTAFTEYLQKYYPKNDAGEIKEQVENWLVKLKKTINTTLSSHILLHRNRTVFFSNSIIIFHSYVWFFTRWFLTMKNLFNFYNIIPKSL